MNRRAIIIVLLILIWTAFIGIQAAQFDPSPPDIFPSPRRANFDIPHGFSPEELKIAIPAIRSNACFLAIGAIRTALKPKIVSFNLCTENYEIAISEDLQNISVSGVAEIGQIRKPFTVKMQHYPPAIWVGGFWVNEVQIK